MIFVWDDRGPCLGLHLFFFFFFFFFKNLCAGSSGYMVSGLGPGSEFSVEVEGS